MKKILAIFGLILLFGSVPVKAQTPFSISVHGGYSWSIGVAGADIQYGRFSLGGGWMPSKMPLTDKRIHSFGAALTYYQPIQSLKGFSAYISAAGASKGYRYEDSWGGELTSPIAIGTVGVQYDLGRFWLKTGGGYGWCKDGQAFAVEAVLGFKLLQN